ncbi:hypothetical protein cyc_04080 [Cyclospora cayetanensis]|uniref:Uncharacterized protein n=1 Tax=Cyclospora cayetanensis TaxID=88456 RepID=A0A1D3D596_9EIME|nr:hypothetical protein cyc_04080 [Cyclospora cayetanensis]
MKEAPRPITEPMGTTRRFNIHCLLICLPLALLIPFEKRFVDAEAAQQGRRGPVSTVASPLNFLSEHILNDQNASNTASRYSPPVKPAGRMVEESDANRSTGIFAGFGKTGSPVSSPPPLSPSPQKPNSSTERNQRASAANALRVQQLDEFIDVDSTDWAWAPESDWEEDQRNTQVSSQPNDLEEEDKDESYTHKGSGVVPEWQLQRQHQEGSALTNVREEEWTLASDEPEQQQSSQRSHNSAQSLEGDSQNQSVQSTVPGNLRRPAAGFPSLPLFSSWEETPQEQQEDEGNLLEDGHAAGQAQDRPQAEKQTGPLQTQQQPLGNEDDASLKRRRRQFINAALAAAQAAAATFFDSASSPDSGSAPDDPDERLDLQQINQQVENLVNDFLNPRRATPSGNTSRSSGTGLRAASVDYADLEAPTDAEMQTHIDHQKDRAQKQLHLQQLVHTQALQQDVLRQEQQSSSAPRPRDPSYRRQDAIEGFEARTRHLFE